MNIKTKLSLGLIFLFAVIGVIGGISIYYLRELSIDSKNIITNNYESLEYMRKVQSALDSLSQNEKTSLLTIEKNIRDQEDNVTEAGEEKSTIDLRTSFNQLKGSPANAEYLAQTKKAAYKIIDLNMNAIVRKNSVAQDTSSQATLYVIVIVTICILISFSFIVNFPGYIANPIVKLTNSIKLIAGKNYEERLHFDRNDEFEELANAFNIMAEKLDEYEHSNLANLLFEKKRIETIINRMHDPIIGLDEKRRILFVNTEALEILSLKEESLIGKYAPDVAVTNDLLRNLIRGVAMDLDAKQEGLIKIYADHKESYFNREVIPISFTPTGEKNSVSIGTVILLKNITPFKELDLAKTNFIATISHELKTPIASLQMGVKLLQDVRVGKLNDEQQRIVTTVNDETNRLLKITGELLDLAQVETGNIRLNMQSVEPLDIIDHAIEAIRFQAEQRHIRLEKKVKDLLPSIQVDRDKTTWVLINFLTNAIRHSAENAQVDIEVAKEKEKIRFLVRDYGMGIDPKYKDKLFERFYQVPGSMTKKGTGLGLSISKEFIEAQGGTIGVESELGNGSAFYFELDV